MRGFFTMTTIQPTNTFKKLIMSQCQNMELTQANCHMLNSYYLVMKHDLFDFKTAVSIKLLPQHEAFKRQQMNMVLLKR
jgi:hypothetical protein